MQKLTLSNETWTLTLLPQWGGRVAELKAGDLDIYTPIQVETFNPLDWPRGGAYPLLPYSNRLRNARLSHAGITHHLPAHPAALPHTLHGVAHTQAWEVVEHSSTHAMVSCVYEGEHWPWPVKFEQRYELDGRRLRQSISLTNLGAFSMPGGLGLHPYFQRHEGMKARFFVAKKWDIDDEYLPVGHAHNCIDVVQVQAFANEELAVYGAGWDGRLDLEYLPGNLVLEASDPLNHFVAFAPSSAPYLCLEPVSHLADAFNSQPQHWPEQGTHILEPGQTLSAQLTFSWAPKQP